MIVNSTETFKRWKIAASACLLLLVLPAGSAVAQDRLNSLKSGFENPPNAARPRVWWHWMNGNISQQGIKLDLEWMKRVGLGGFQVFDASLDTPQVVEKRLVYMTPEWKDAFSYATKLADQMGLEEAIAGSPGWSETGGPWVPPAQGMKKYVWSETMVEGGKPFSGKLAKPPSNAGPFQNLKLDAEQEFAVPDFYADSAVIAYRAPLSDLPKESVEPKITSSGGTIDTVLLADGDLNKTTTLPGLRAGEKAWIQYEFVHPQTVRSLTIVIAEVLPWYIAPAAATGRALEASGDGLTYHVVAQIPFGGSAEHTISFAPITARYFRVTFQTLPEKTKDGQAESSDSNTVTKLPAYKIAELVLHSGARVNRFEEKAAFNPLKDLYEFATPQVAASDAIQKSDVVDVTGKMRADGSLDWTPPHGNWVVLRFGYSLLGITNHPATKEATGLEVDKLNAGYVKNYMNGYLDSYKDTVGAEMLGKRGIRYVITDSWEAGAQNWTDDMIAKFTQRRGYDPRPWMPVLTGRVVESAQASDQFLWDLRKTIADLTADEHYSQVEASLKERGLGHYGESHEGGRALIADGMEVKKLDDIPMGAMWTQRPGVNNPQYGSNADDRESASVAHIYGQNLAAAESMTAGGAAWAWSPATLKPTADQEFLNGINRIVIHESTHQPLTGKNKAPGMTLGFYGQWFNRNETWAEQAGPWVSYLARSSYMLQQGRFSADILYFYGEDSNLTAIFEHKSPEVPVGYGFDYINADGLIHQLDVTDGCITTKSGMSYRVLRLDPYSKHMSLPVLQALRKLVEAGALISGDKPAGTPSLADDKRAFQTLATELFGDGTGDHVVGKGKVYAGQSLQDVLAKIKIKPDFDDGKQKSDTRVEFVHRTLPNDEIYFIDNRNEHDAILDATFRVAGKAPELWYAETGLTRPATYKTANGGTTVPLHLEPWGTVFVVFHRPTSMTLLTLPKVIETKVATVNSPWKVSFEPDLGAPPSIALNSLISWPESEISGVKYYSGKGTYTTTMQASAEWFKPGAKLWMDLGDVKNLAEVTVNGKLLGIVWHAPFRVDATTALKPGVNQLKITVINAWVNRLIGDEQPGATKYTYADFKPYNAQSPLLPSGLLGPVTILETRAELLEKSVASKH